MSAEFTNTPSQTVTRTARPTQNWLGLGRVNDMLALRRSRRDLAELDDHQLMDIGVTRGAARKEASRSFWDFSDHWLARR